MTARHGMKSAWAFHGNISKDGFGTLQLPNYPRSNHIATLMKNKRGVNPTPLVNWWLGDDGIVAKTTYDSGLGTLKRWTGTQWVPAALKVRTF